MNITSTTSQSLAGKVAIAIATGASAGLIVLVMATQVPGQRFESTVGEKATAAA